VNLKNRYLAAFLAWLVPGLGHWYQGRRAKAWIYGLSILGLFFFGLWLGEGKNVFWRWTSPTSDPERFRFDYLAQFWVGLPALPALIQATLIQKGMAPILGGYLAEPPMEVLSGLFPRLGRLLEVGWVYTVTAGLLNVLAIYDALDGPAHADESGDLPAAGEPNRAALAAEGRA
jgi:hypothetical protein